MKALLKKWFDWKINSTWRYSRNEFETITLLGKISQLAPASWLHIDSFFRALKYKYIHRYVDYIYKVNQNISFKFLGHARMTYINSKTQEKLKKELGKLYRTIFGSQWKLIPCTKYGLIHFVFEILD